MFFVKYKNITDDLRQQLRDVKIFLEGIDELKSSIHRHYNLRFYVSINAFREFLIVNNTQIKSDKN